MKAFQIITKEHRTLTVNHFVFAETEKEAKEKFNRQESFPKDEEIIAFTEDIIEINEVECNLVEEENEYTKNYPKKEEDKRTFD